MGIQDLEKLFQIKQQIKKIDKKRQYNFMIDTDTKEGRTRIIINEFGKWQKAPCLTKEEAYAFREEGFKQFVPRFNRF